LHKLRERVEIVFQSLPEYRFEWLLIDNASTDDSKNICLKFAAEDDRYRYIRFSRNFNPEASISAGYEYCHGDAAIIVFSDLQDPPELVPALIAKWEEGNDVVSGIVNKRSDSNLLYNLASRLLYFFLYVSSKPRITQNATDYKLLDRAVINALSAIRERDRFSRGLVNWTGYREAFVSFDRMPRQFGLSFASVWHRISFAITAITSFTTVPLRLIFVSGIALMLSASLFTAYRIFVNAGVKTHQWPE